MDPHYYYKNKSKNYNYLETLNFDKKKYLVTLLRLNYFDILPELTFDGRIKYVHLILATYIMLAMLKY